MGWGNIFEPIAAVATAPLTGGASIGFLGAERGAKAAARAAEDQQDAARAARGDVLREGRRIEKSAIDYASSPQELRAYESSLSAAEKQLNMDQRLIDAIDPSLMEASKQVLGLLRGETSSTGGVLSSERARQRQSLVNTLRQQLGPGAETSSAGLKALAQFDAESANLGAANQNSSLASLMGVINSRPNLSMGLNALNTAGQNFGNRANRISGAQMQTGSSLLAALTGANQSVISTAGAGNVYGQLMGQWGQQMGNNLMNLSGQITGAALGGGLKGGGGAPAAPTTVDTAGGSYRNVSNIA